MARIAPNLPTGMRPITKILLLIVVGFFVYVLWPRTPKLDGFKPAEIAPLEVRSWISERDGKGLDLITQVYKIYTHQLGFSPIASFRIGMSESGGVEKLRKLTHSDDREARALRSFQEKYAIIKRDSGKAFSSDDLAREEIAWRTAEIDAAPYDQIANSMANVLAGLYGGEPKRFADIAYGIVSARALLHGAELPEGFSDPVSAAEEIAQQAFTELKELQSPAQPEPAP